MDSYLISQIFEGLGTGNIPKVFGYGFIFLAIWLEVRGMKKQLKVLNETISTSFSAGEKRFENIENDVHSIKLDLEKIKQPKEGHNGNFKQATIT